MIKLMEMLLEDMGIDVADAIFAKYDINHASSLPKEQLKAVYKELALKFHPDKGGNNEDMKYINAAYDVLKTATAPTSPTTFYSSPPDWPAHKTYPKNPKTKHTYTTKMNVEFRSVLNGRLLHQGQCDQIDFMAILNKLKNAKVYTEVEGNIIYVDVAGFSRILPDLLHFFKE